MNTDTVINRKYAYYICGRCGYKIFYLKNEERPNPCTECGWEHETLGVNDIPSEIKIDLNNPNG